MKTQRSKFGNKIIFLDLETTGFSPQTCDIIEIGAWLFEDGVAVEKFSRRIKPEKYVPIAVQKLTGITNEMLAECETIDHVLPEFVDFCADEAIAGYNVDFDYRFLTYKSKLLGYDFTLGGRRLGLDVLSMAKAYFPNLSNHKLVTVAKHLEIPLEDGNLHTASYDAYITKLVYDRMPSATPVLLDRSKYGRPVITDTLSFE